MQNLISSMNKKVVILDYEMGNLFSVKNAFLSFGVETTISSDKTVIAAADAVILPGVGAFGEAMTNLKRLQIVEPLRDAVLNFQKPLLDC